MFFSFFLIKKNFYILIKNSYLCWMVRKTWRRGPVGLLMGRCGFWRRFDSFPRWNVIVSRPDFIVECASSLMSEGFGIAVFCWFCCFLLIILSMNQRKNSVYIFCIFIFLIYTMYSCSMFKPIFWYIEYESVSLMVKRMIHYNSHVGFWYWAHTPSDLVLFLLLCFVTSDDYNDVIERCLNQQKSSTGYVEISFFIFILRKWHC